MGLIREPRDVDFYVIDKVWTEEERKEFSEFIKQRKKQFKTRLRRTELSRRKKQHA